MKYCEHCGAEMNDEAQFCPKCGQKVGEDLHENTSVNTSKGERHYNNVCRKVAFGFMVFSMVCTFLAFLICVITFGNPNASAEIASTSKGAACIYLIPLLWQIPMTVVVFKGIKDGRHIGLGFKICTLIFVSLVSGILLLCDSEKDY